MDKNIFGDTKILVLYLGRLSLSLKNNSQVSDFVYSSSKIDYFSVKWTFLANFGLKIVIIVPLIPLFSSTFATN